VNGVAVASASSRVNLEAARAVSTEVVHVGGVLPVGVDGGVVVESALQQHVVSFLTYLISTLSNGPSQDCQNRIKTYNAGGEANRGVEVVAEMGVDVVRGDVGGA
jgi:hypothetical protein